MTSNPLGWRCGICFAMNKPTAEPCGQCGNIMRHTSPPDPLRWMCDCQAWNQTDGIDVVKAADYDVLAARLSEANTEVQRLTHERDEAQKLAQFNIAHAQEGWTERDRLLAALEEIGSLATPENPEDDERQFARMREIALAAISPAAESAEAVPNADKVAFSRPEDETATPGADPSSRGFSAPNQAQRPPVEASAAPGAADETGESR